MNIILVDKYGQAKEPASIPHFLDVLLYLEDGVDDGRFVPDEERPTWRRAATDILRIVSGENVHELLSGIKNDYVTRG